MRKFFINLLKISILLFIGLVVLSIMNNVNAVSKDIEIMPEDCNRYIFINCRSGDTVDLSKFKISNKCIYMYNGIVDGKHTIRPVTDADNCGLRIEDKALKADPDSKETTLGIVGSYYFILTSDQGWVQVVVQDLELKFYDGSEEAPKENEVYKLEKNKKYTMKVIDHYVYEEQERTSTYTLTEMCGSDLYKEKAIIYDNTKINGIKATNHYKGGNTDSFKPNQLNEFSKVVKPGLDNKNYYYADYTNSTFTTGSEKCSQFTYNLDWRYYYQKPYNIKKGGNWIKITAEVEIIDENNEEIETNVVIIDSTGKEIEAGSYLLYKDVTNEGGWNLRKNSTSGALIGEIKDGDYVEVIKMATDGTRGVKVEVLSGNLEGETGWLNITIDGEENFTMYNDVEEIPGQDIEGNTGGFFEKIKNIIKKIKETITNMFYKLLNPIGFNKK